MEKCTDGFISSYEGIAFECIDPPGNSVIIHAADLRAGIDKVEQTHLELTRAFPNNLVVSVPDTDSVACLDKQSTIEFLQAMISSLQSKEFM